MKRRTELPSPQRASAADREAIRDLLRASALPADLDAGATQLWIARARDELVGVIGLEGTGPVALLRSLAVAPAWRRRGLGRALVERVEVDAAAAGVHRLVLLTGTARAFFEALGYTPMERSAVPAPVTDSAEFTTLCAGADCLARTLPVVIYHNPLCGTSRAVLDRLREAGIEPRVVEYLNSPPDRQTLETLIARMGTGVRALLRQKGTHFDELDLGDARWTDAQLLERMLATPILINRPVVVTPRGVKLCRPSQTVEELLSEEEAAALRQRFPDR
jgi:arsenate reductase